MASLLLYFAAAMYVVLAALLAMSIEPVTHDPALDPGAADSMRFGFLTYIVLLLVIAAVLVVLGILDRVGKNAARIVTWAFAGLPVLCSGLFAVSGVVGAGQQGATVVLPQWYTVVDLTSAATATVAVVVACVLLALPASNRFYRERRRRGEQRPGVRCTRASRRPRRGTRDAGDAGRRSGIRRTRGQRPRAAARRRCRPPTRG
jgi:hypothetical protein